MNFELGVDIILIKYHFVKNDTLEELVVRVDTTSPQGSYMR